MKYNGKKKTLNYKPQILPMVEKATSFENAPTTNYQLQP